MKVRYFSAIQDKFTSYSNKLKDFDEGFSSFQIA